MRLHSQYDSTESGASARQVYSRGSHREKTLLNSLGLPDFQLQWTRIWCFRVPVGALSFSVVTGRGSIAVRLCPLAVASSS